MGEEAAGEELHGRQWQRQQRGYEYLRLAFFDVYIFVTASESEELVVEVRHDADAGGGILDEWTSREARRGAKGSGEECRREEQAGLDGKFQLPLAATTR